jgi:DNA-binding MarR family transcriptional regulator
LDEGHCGITVRDLLAEKLFRVGRHHPAEDHDVDRGHLLAALDEWGPASQASLGRGTGIDRSDVTAALVDLEERGLVQRDVNQADRRRNVVSITAAGVRHLEALDSVVDEIQERLLAPLSEGERRQFITLMRRIAAGD